MYDFIPYIKTNSKRSKDLHVKKRTLKIQNFFFFFKVRKFFLNRAHNKLEAIKKSKTNKFDFVWKTF